MKEKDYDSGCRKCPECGSKSIIIDSIHAELFCADCGVVIEENIVDLGPEWRAFEPSQTTKRIRTGPPMNYRIYDKGLGTQSPASIIRSKRLKQTIDMVSSEKTFIFGLNSISRVASLLNLSSDTIEEASLLFRKAVKRNLIKGHSIESIAAAALYIASKMHKIPRTLKEIEEILGSKKINAKKINQEHIYLLEKLKLKVPRSYPIEYLARFCSELGLNADILSKATEICVEAEKAEIVSIRHPERIAGAAILGAFPSNGRSVIQRKLSELIGVSEHIIKARHELLKSLKREDIETGQEETRETKRKKMKTMKELVDEIIIGNRISDTLERFDPEGNIREAAIKIGTEFEKQEKEGKRKNRKATAIAALLVTLEKYLSWYKETLSNGINIKAIIKRKEIMREFDIINKK